MTMAEATTAPETATAETAVAPAPLSGETHLEYLIRNTQACVLRPYCFFVSWQGVLTLAYRGFPPALVALKEQVSDYYLGLPKESPGSKWPKTSLASLKEGKRLTPAQLQRLNELCREQSGIFQAPGHRMSQAVHVSSLSTVVYESRCLERAISRRTVELAQPTDPADASPEEIKRVQGVVAEADDQDYWFHASRDGNREKHYRAAALGVTLVHELDCFQNKQQDAAAAPAAVAAAATADQAAATNGAAAAEGSSPAAAASNPAAALLSSIGVFSGASNPGTPTQAGGSNSSSSSVWSSALPGIMTKFRAAVEAEFPGLYAWFDDQSLHITIRAIIV